MVSVSEQKSRPYLFNLSKFIQFEYIVISAIYPGFPLKFQKKNLGKKNKNLGKFIKKNCPLEGVREKLN